MGGKGWQGKSTMWAKTEVLHPDTEEWQEDRSSFGVGLGLVSDYCSSQLSDSEVLVVGGEVPDGEGGTQLSKRARIYNFDSQEWVELPSMPHGRAGHGCAVLKVRYRILLLLFNYCVCRIR